MFSTVIGGKTPDITPAQILGVIATVIGLLLSNKTVDGHTAKLITDLAAIIVPAAWMIADAIIRHGRAKALLGVVPVAPTVKP